MSRPHVVIIGGGFGGLAAARALAKANVTITLIDRRNHHLFQPLLYQVATAALNASDIAYPIRAAVAKQKNARVLLATAKSIDDALEIRKRIFTAYEAAERESDPQAQKEWLTFVVVGGGPTGVELSGALGEIGLHTLANDFRTIDPTQVQVVLFEGGDRVLGAYPPKLSEAAKKSLNKRHVDVRLNTRVTAIDDKGVTYQAGETKARLGARTVLWAAGVQASPLGKTLGVPLDKQGRVEVKPDLSIPGHPRVFVIGDLAKMLNADGTQVPGVAQGALQGGKYVAGLIKAEVEDRADGNPVDPPAERKPFSYWDKGNMATIGRASAVVATKRVAIHGLFAWLMWWVIHILFLVGFKNRVLVMFHWAWNWLTFSRGARLITGEVKVLPPVRSIDSHGEPVIHHGAHAVTLPVEQPQDSV